MLNKNRIFHIIFLLSILFSLFLFYNHYGSSTHRLPYHDTLFLQYPYKFFISSSIQNGFIPLWDHWTNNGVSLSASLSSLHFSPIVYLFSLFGTYSFTTILLEMLLIQIIGFFGMYLWIKEYSNRWIGLYTAFIFSTTPALLGTIGESAVLVSMNIIPLLSYTIKRCLEGSFRYSGLLSIILWIMFTSGYFGINVMYLPIIAAFSVGHTISQRKNIALLKNGLINILTGVVLFLGITNFQWIESYVYTQFDYSMSRTYAFNPFDGATGFKTLFTLFFTHNFPSFIQQTAIISAPGVTNMIFFGVINLVFVALALYSKKARLTALLIYAVMLIIFVFSLHSYTTFLETIITSIPFLKITRWHGWYNALFIFYGLTLATYGMNHFLNEKKEVAIKKLLLTESVIFLFILFSTALLILLSKPFSFSFAFLQAFVLLIIIVITAFIINYSKLPSIKKEYILAFILLVGLVEYIPNTINALTFRDRWDPAFIDSKTAEQFEKQKIYTFSKNQNIRENSINQFITKTPTINAYDPYTDKRIIELRNTLGKEKFEKVSKYIFYFPDDSGYPKMEEIHRIKISKFYPNEIQLIVNADSKKSIVWSTPYTPNWKLEINNNKSKLKANGLGFFRFDVKKGENIIKLIYDPPYLKISMLLMLLSICASILIFITPRFKRS